MNENIYYERRINYYRNKGKKNIISIQKLFQLYTSQILFKPSQVKTNPKAMFESTYDAIFPAPSVKNTNYILYLVPILTDITITKKIRQIQRAKSIISQYKKTLLSYGKLHLGTLTLSSILKTQYNPKNIIDNVDFIKTELENDIDNHFSNALNQLEKMIKGLSGNRKEAIPSAVRKGELDKRIVKFVKSR